MHQKIRKWVAERYTEAFQKKILRKSNIDTEKIQGVTITPPLGQRKVKPSCNRHPKCVRLSNALFCTTINSFDLLAEKPLVLIGSHCSHCVFASYSYRHYACIDLSYDSSTAERPWEPRVYQPISRRCTIVRLIEFRTQHETNCNSQGFDIQSEPASMEYHGAS